MRILFGSPPRTILPSDTSAAGRPIRQPGGRTSAFLATFSGVLLLAVPVGINIAYSILFPDPAGESIPREALPWLGMLVFLVFGIVAHELLHAVLHPQFGRSDSSLLFLGWKRLQFGVYYEGRFPRNRWIAMRLLPLIVLAFAPTAVFVLWYARLTFEWETYLIILMLVNSLGSGADLVAVLVVLWQVPAGGVLNFYRGRAFWRTAEEDRLAQRSATAIIVGDSSANGARS